MQAGGNNNDKNRVWQSKNCFEGSVEGGLREVTHEFGGQPLNGGSNRAHDTVVVAPLSIFLWFVVRVWCQWFLILLFLPFCFFYCSSLYLMSAKLVE
jgi:hypothetical protein